MLTGIYRLLEMQNVLICIENLYLIIDWLIVTLYMHCELLKSTYLFNINK